MKTTNVSLLGFILLLAVVAHAVLAGDRTGTERIEENKGVPAIARGVVKVEISPTAARDEEEFYVVSEDKEKIDKLLAFFPELGQDSADVGADWPPSYDLRFLREDGECFLVYVHISQDKRFTSRWNGVGNGDWPLKDPKGFKKLMSSFLGPKEHKKEEAPQAPTLADIDLDKPSDVLALVAKVEIQRAPNRNKGRAREQFVTIKDKKKIDKLLAFFPEMLQVNDHFNSDAAWVADYHIKCTLKGGYYFEIRVSWDLKWWRARAEWRLKNPDKFEKLVDDWLKEK